MAQSDETTGNWRVVDGEGKTLRRFATLPTPLPFPVVPGTIASFTLGEWLMLVDIQYTWDAGSGQWVQGGAWSLLPEPPTEPQIWQTRHSLLRHFGWV